MFLLGLFIGMIVGAWAIIVYSLCCISGSGDYNQSIKDKEQEEFLKGYAKANKN